MADINLFTQAMNAAFMNSMQDVGKPAPVDTFTEEFKSNGREENYNWMTPTPGISRYKGYRRIAQISDIKYKIINYPFDATISVDLRDLDDDQIGGYKRRFQNLAQKTKAPFRNRFVLQTLGLGKSTTCFDGTNFFATTHTLGGYNTAIPGTTTNTGGNLLKVTVAASDGATHRFVVMVSNPESPLKPMIFQNRKPFDLKTDAGTPQADKAMRADWWVHGEAAVGFGYWWDAVMVEFDNTPTVLELITALQCAQSALMQFSLPTALPSDPLEYPHEQHVWTPETVSVVCSPNIYTRLRQVLMEPLYGISQAGSTSGINPNNMYQGMFNLVPTNQLA